MQAKESKKFLLSQKTMRRTLLLALLVLVYFPIGLAALTSTMEGLERRIRLLEEGDAAKDSKIAAQDSKIAAQDHKIDAQDNKIAAQDRKIDAQDRCPRCDLGGAQVWLPRYGG